MAKLCCDMCSKPLKGVRHMVEVPLRPGHFLVVGPECFRKAKKARQQLRERMTPEQIETLRAKIAAANP